MTKCSQCDKDAMYNVNGHLLCLNCYYKIERMQAEKQTQCMAMLNYFSSQLDYTLGLTDNAPQLEIPKLIYQNIPINKLNHINVNNSNIGTINTGDFPEIESNLSILYAQGKTKLGDSLKDFTNELIGNKELDDSTKNEILEQLSFITSLLQQKDAKKSIIQPIWDSIKEKVSSINNFISLCSNISKIIELLG